MSNEQVGKRAARQQASPRKYAALSIGAAVLTIGLKSAAFLATGSVGLLSDAMESVVNLVAALVAFWALSIAALPPDEEHAYGHTKAEYFSSGVEAALILLAAVGIAIAAVERLRQPEPLAHVWVGLGIATLASLVNGGVSVTLMRAGKRMHSITLQADAAHLMTDVWTSGGVFVGVVLVEITHWLPLDPIVAILVAANIVFTGYRLMDNTIHGLLDTALPGEDRQKVVDVLAPYRERGIEFHAFRSRSSGNRRFMSMHVLAPGAWTIQQGHDLCEEIEHSILEVLPRSTVFTHLEPQEDPLAFADQTLDRAVPEKPEPGATT
ncbi:MAG TPA: cation diffusion facilitator family transporter [Armatimonadota bacterium]|jgi:cation diffusion facilitator family transporter